MATPKIVSAQEWQQARDTCAKPRKMSAAAGRNIFGMPRCLEVRMRAFAVRSFGEPASVHDLSVPTADTEVLDARAVRRSQPRGRPISWDG